MPEEVHAQGVCAGTVLLIQLRRHRHGAQVWILAADDREDLQTVHLRHLQVANQQLERLSLQRRYDERSRGSRMDLRPARQLRQHLLVHIQQIRIVVGEQNLRARIHYFQLPPLTRYRGKLKHEKPHVVSRLR